MKHFDLFSGYGGFTLALEKVYANNRELLPGQAAEDIQELLSEPSSGQARTIGFSEIDKYASAVLKYHWLNIKNYGDITKIDWAEVPDFDLLTGGSPCQDLSIAGKRAGLEGARSGLFYEYMRAVREKQPKYFIWENVKGALSSQKGWDFAYVLNEMAETGNIPAGYSLWWQVLNAKDFGVPQNRERIFVVGTRTDIGSPREVFFEAGSSGKNIVEDDTTEIHKQTQKLSDAFRIRSTSGASATLKGLGGGMGAKTGLYDVSRCPLKFLDRNQKNIEGDYAFTVDSMNTGGVKVDTRIRRLTPTECERLMGLPDDWLKYGIDEKGNQFEIFDSQKYKLAGNGVVVNVVEEIIKNIIL